MNLAYALPLQQSRLIEDQVIAGGPRILPAPVFGQTLGSVAGEQADVSGVQNTTKLMSATGAVMQATGETLLQSGQLALDLPEPGSFPSSGEMTTSD